MKRKFVTVVFSLFLLFTIDLVAQGGLPFKVIRFSENPIITPEMSNSIGENINGPSLIRVPDWLANPLGKYYLYFAHHNGKFIRLAYADKIEGPWKIYEPGTLKLSQTICTSHIASPDIHIDAEKKEIQMYFHGPVKNKKGQYSFLAYSKDGINFTADDEILGESYFRVFKWKENFYAVAKGGEIYKSSNGKNNFESSGIPFPDQDTSGVHIRHVALDLNGDTLSVFFSCVGDAPERIMMSQIILNEEWKNLKASSPVMVLEPELHYEGVDLPIKISNSGPAKSILHELRDPAIYKEGGRTYMLYSIGGENGIAITELRK